MVDFLSSRAIFRATTGILKLGGELNMRFMLCLSVLGLALCPILGCSGRPPVGSVAGTVTLNGEPLPNVGLIFQPVGSGADHASDAVGGAETKKGAKYAANHIPSYGQTDSNGEFTLKFSDNSRAGALVGEHMVIITEKQEGATPDDDEPPRLIVPKTRSQSRPSERSKIPLKWRDGSARFTVNSGTNQADLELSN
jgi:hypothetical protein